MIFVILGIIILVVSFVVALLSLIREQKVVNQRAEEEPEVGKRKTGQVVQKQQFSEDGASENNGEPFPWEGPTHSLASRQEPKVTPVNPQKSKRLSGVINVQQELSKREQS